MTLSRPVQTQRLGVYFHFSWFHGPIKGPNTNAKKWQSPFFITVKMSSKNFFWSTHKLSKGFIANQRQDQLYLTAYGVLCRGSLTFLTTYFPQMPPRKRSTTPPPSRLSKVSHILSFFVWDMNGLNNKKTTITPWSTLSLGLPERLLQLKLSKLCEKQFPWCVVK